MENRSASKRRPRSTGSITASTPPRSCGGRRRARACWTNARWLRCRRGCWGSSGSQIEEITRGESSSVPAETADQLMDDIGYCIDVALKHASDPAGEHSRCSGNTRWTRSTGSGTGLLDREERACEGLLSRVRATRTPTVNEGYRILLDVTFPRYLRDWKVRRHPGDFVVLTEYPLAREVSESGIFGVRERLESLALGEPLLRPVRAGAGRPAARLGAPKPHLPRRGLCEPLYDHAPKPAARPPARPGGRGARAPGNAPGWRSGCAPSPPNSARRCCCGPRKA